MSHTMQCSDATKGGSVGYDDPSHLGCGFFFHCSFDFGLGRALLRLAVAANRARLASCGQTVYRPIRDHGELHVGTDGTDHMPHDPLSPYRLSAVGGALFVSSEI